MRRRRGPRRRAKCSPQRHRARIRHSIGSSRASNRKVSVRRLDRRRACASKRARPILLTLSRLIQTSTSACRTRVRPSRAHREVRRAARAGRHRLGAPDRRAHIALALRVGRIFLVQHHALRDGGDGSRALRRSGFLFGRLRRLADAIGDLRTRRRCVLWRLGGTTHFVDQRRDAVALPVCGSAKPKDEQHCEDRRNKPDARALWQFTEIIGGWRAHRPLPLLALPRLGNALRG